MLGQAFYVTHIDRLRPSDDVGAHLDVVRLGAVTVGEVGFGTDLRLRSGELGSYHVDVPLSGSIQWRQGTGATETATPERAGVFQPDGATTIDRWQAGCRLLALKIRTADLERHLEHMLGRSVGAPVRFAAGFDVSRGRGSAGHGWYGPPYGTSRTRAACCTSRWCRPRCKKRCWAGCCWQQTTRTARS